ncbi:unnamed protein product [Orchesella dallaii]|uniref:Uncharacterized protein n=1 Tax=Orchesella dallaii TaxID=48710 RepID=A0ABP1RK15_9HEXA
MTTAFNKFVYRLNESFSSPWFLSLLSWDHCSSEWRFETNKWKLFIHFFIPFGITAPGLLGICGIRYVENVLYPNVVTKTEQTTLLIVVALILYVLMIEVILFKHGNIIAQMTNKHAEFERKNFYGNIAAHSNKRVWETKESLNSTFDWVGVFLLILAVVAKPSVGLMMFLLVYTNNDPLFFASLGLSHFSFDACHSIFFNCFTRNHCKASVKYSFEIITNPSLTMSMIIFENISCCHVIPPEVEHIESSRLPLTSMLFQRTR